MDSDLPVLWDVCDFESLRGFLGITHTGDGIVSATWGAAAPRTSSTGGRAGVLGDPFWVTFVCCFFVCF